MQARLASAFGTTDARNLPSWWECSTCALCQPSGLAQDAAPAPELHNSRGACPLCTGCTHHLELLNLSVALPLGGEEKVVRMHQGNTGASVFRALDAAGEASVLKLHGVVTSMVSAGKLAQTLQLYRERRYLSHETVLAHALTVLADECGLGGVSVRERLAYVRAVVPQSGEKVEEQRAVLSEFAEGASLEMLTLKLSSAQLLAVLDTVRHEAVRDAAIFDLLFTQGDRHSENLFVDGGGYFKLIDSRDGAIGDGLDSIFFAGSWSHERSRVGNMHMYNRSVMPVSHHWPQTTLDYRCHVPGGALGHNYPPRVAHCLGKWAAMTPADFLQTYFLPAVADGAVLAGTWPMIKAERVIEQAKNMLQLGFEDALRRTKHKNATGRMPFVSGFPEHPPCCKVRLAVPNSVRYACLSQESAAPPARQQALALAAPQDNRAAWQLRVGHAIVSAGGDDVFETVPAAGFDPAYKNPCWHNGTSLLCLPYFHIIGVSKCGTTDLFRRLSLHPHLAPSRNKGPHFWDEAHTFQWYLNIYEHSASFVQQDPANAVIGDASSNTLTYSGVGVRNNRHPPASLASVLAALQPRLRLIAVLRNPVDRMYSSYYYYGHYAKQYGADAEGFHKYAAAQLTVFSACAAGSSRRQCAVEGYGRAEQLSKGLYAAFLPDYLDAFPREQLLVLRSEDYGAGLEGALRTVLAHLRMAQPAEGAWQRMLTKERSNSRKGNGASRGGRAGEMQPETRRMLTDFYRPYNTELAELLSDRSYLRWNNPEPEGGDE